MALKCPKCKSTHVQLIGTDMNIKSVKQKTTLNLNPFSSTVFKTKEKVKKKKSAGKVALGIATAGVSTKFTGKTSNKGREFHCLECGTTFRTK